MRNMFKYLVYIKIYHILYYNIRDNRYNILKNDPQQDALRRRVYKTAVRLFITIHIIIHIIINISLIVPVDPYISGFLVCGHYRN